jgi:hypothetical protein
MHERRFPLVARADLAGTPQPLPGYLLTRLSLTDFKGSAKLAPRLEQRGWQCLIK